MDEQKRLAIKIAGIKTRFPYSAHEPSPQQKFDMMWPSLQREFMDRAAQILRESSQALTCSGNSRVKLDRANGLW